MIKWYHLRARFLFRTHISCECSSTVRVHPLSALADKYAPVSRSNMSPDHATDSGKHMRPNTHLCDGRERMRHVADLDSSHDT